MNVQEAKLPPAVLDKFRAEGSEFIGYYLVNGWIKVIVCREDGELHCSISHPTRYPTWDEIRDIRYRLLPNHLTFGLLFPPREQYVNLHPNCFHLYEILTATKEPQRIIIP